ncbi:dihydropteroate synthase [Robertkochia solimangrovi]|uniref:dihydropteroate synthase n=1 Tax=Robertkochia solimangrovi TaxID=2213046 RepID=UPI00117C576C|nr:dihydropteroate synthase [Robertkochia solimangrovi]TRZ41691.1 dihydropteroate synthase [Robertkochia solimangrovi]
MTINCKGKLIDLTTPRVMGILNVTTDSFYDGGTLRSDADLLKRAENMLEEGATFLDIGAYSSRPGAKDIPEPEEIRKSVEATEIILKNFPEALISVDTFRASVAKENILAGAAIVNDIAAGFLDEAMIPTVGSLGVPYIMMHMRGTPQNMQQQTGYSNIMQEMIYYFSERLEQARIHKINDCIIDPGFGFAKTKEENFEVLRRLDLLKMLEKPILSGISRKSMIYKSLGGSPETALNGTTILNTLSLERGANILRVHDVKEAMECVKLVGLTNPYTS